MEPISAINTNRTSAPASPVVQSTAAPAAAAAAPKTVETPTTSTESQVNISAEALADEEGGSIPNLDALGGQEAAEETEKPQEGEELKPEDLEKMTPEQQAEQLRKQIEKLREKMARQLEEGDEAGARATEAQIGSLTRQLDRITNPPATPQAPAGGAAPVEGAAPAAAAPAAAAAAPMAAAPAGGAAPAGWRGLRQAACPAPAGGAAPASDAGTTFGASNAPAVDPEALARTSPLGQKIAEAGQRNCNGSGGWCFKHVSAALRECGIETSGASAYMAADQLAQSDKLREVQVNPQDLPKLPAGAVVVWDRGNGHEHGHISISDGKGGEYSDVYRQQTTNYGTQCRVFLPADMQDKNQASQGK